jgi:two-component system OmpR family sensor kinase
MVRNRLSQCHSSVKAFGAVMRNPRSIRFRLSAVLLLFFALVIVLGLFSIGRLGDFNRVSADIRDLWLPNTRLLGDLNNFTSDFRAAEGNYLLGSTATETAASQWDMEELDRLVAQALTGYEQLRHDGADAALYAQFKARWTEYRGIVDKVTELARTDKAAATALYMARSRTTYTAASDLLGQLTERNVASAHQASVRSQSAFEQARLLIWMAMLVAAMMGVGALAYVRRAISRPLLDLADRMHRLAASDVDIDIHGTERRDEIGEMARAVVVFRNNAIELMVTQQGLAQQASMLEDKLAHEQRLTQLQRNFVSMASHEFRTPLTIIDGHAQRLIKMSDRLRAGEIVERAGKVRAAVLRMTNLMGNLLDASRLFDGGGGLYFHPAEFDVAALLREVCHLHREIAPGSQIWENFSAAPLRLVGDAKLLFQVFSNLIANAVKYSPAGGLIKVTVAPESGGIAVVVEDHGMGIPDKDVAQLFTRYYRGSNVSGIVGTGVGLYLVKMVVELHGGSVAAESREGRGSRFIVRLPFVPAGRDAEPSPAPPDAGAAAKQIASELVRIEVEEVVGHD